MLTSSQFLKCAAVLALSSSTVACAQTKPQSTSQVDAVAIGYLEDNYTIGELLYETDFSDRENWELQIQQSDSPTTPQVNFGDGMLDIYMPDRGCTAWLKQKFEGAIAITYRVRCPEETLSFPEIQARDINNFWHASDPAVEGGLFDSERYDGEFGSYHKMHGYYASTGGGGSKGNHTTRFRRYPRHNPNAQDVQHIALNDRDGQPDYLITPGKWHTVQLVAANGLAQYIMDGKVFYEIREGDGITIESGKDPVTQKIYTHKEFPAHTEGYLGLRLVKSHHQYTDLKVYRLNTKKKVSSQWENNLFDRIEAAPVGGGFEQADYWVWGSSVAKDDAGKFHMFVSRWPKALPFHPGWMVASEVAHCISDTAEGPYKFVDVALGARGAKYWDGQSVHNPRVVKYKDTYVMYYMGSTHPFADITDPAVLTLDSAYTVVARSNKRIGIATSKSLDGPWERRDTCILETQPDTFYEFLTSNPAPWINEDGSVKLIFKSRKYNESFPYHSSMKIGLATADHFEGPYSVASDEPIFGVDKVGEIEDPYLWRDDSGYHLIAKDQQGKVSGHFHSGILAHSEDAIHWIVDKDPVAYTRKILWNDGKTIEMGQLERPFGLIQKGKLTHLFFATMDGPGGFGNSTKSWNMVVPLNLKKGVRREKLEVSD